MPKAIILKKGTEKVYPAPYWPIGSIYISVTDINPSKWFGGTWVSFGTGKVLVGVDTSQAEFNTVEKTGGEKEHTLTEEEIANHIHFGLNYSSSNIPISFKRGSGATQTGYGLDYTSNTGIYQGSNFRTGSAGESQPHNNLQPYITCYMWKRTA